MLEILDTLFRGVALGLGLLFTILWLFAKRLGLAAESQRPGARLVFGAFAVTFVVYLLASWPLLHAARPAWNFAKAEEAPFFALSFPLAMWGLALLTFNDRMTRPIVSVLLIAALVVLHIMPLFVDWMVLPRMALRVLATALVCAALVLETMRGYQGDLVDSRRKLRPWLLGLSLLLVVAAVVSEWWEHENGLPARRYLGQALGFSLFGLLACLIFIRQSLSRQAEPVIAGPRAAPKSEGLGVEGAVLAKIDAAMADEIWREEGLTIAALAERIAVPEYVVRRTINRGLGFRNFPQFLNQHRIAEATKVLSDPANSHLSITALAFELGFGSLGSFTRAFREHQDLNPSAFRKQALTAKT